MKTASELTETFPDIPALMQAVARRFVHLAQSAVAHRGIFTIALAGGSTPKALYTLLATDPGYRDVIPWSKIHFFFGDERHVPPDHADSNFRMAGEALFNRLPGDPLHVHRITGESPDAADAAARYEAEMKTLFATLGVVENGFPRFDLILLGMGPDGHTASLFPGTTALGETTRWVAATWVEKFKTHRITMTYPVLNNAAEILLVVAGPDKAPVIAEIMARADDAPKYPVESVQTVNGIKRWMLDKAAAGSL